MHIGAMVSLSLLTRVPRPITATTPTVPQRSFQPMRASYRVSQSLAILFTLGVGQRGRDFVTCVRLDQAPIS